MHKRGLRASIQLMKVALIAVGMVVSLGGSVAAHSGKPDARSVLRQEMQILWTGHAVWMRDYIIASTTGNEEKAALEERLLRNPEDFGFSIARFYGIENSKKFADLLKAHALIAFEAIEAAKSGDKTRLEAADKKWHENGADLASLLNQLNPRYWPRQSLSDAWNRHLSLTMNQISARLQKNWKDDVAAFDEDYDCILMLAECITDGIIKQFSSKFYSPS